MGLSLDDFRPGIGDVGEAQKRIKPGMTKDEVRAILGRPRHEMEYGRDGSEWRYWETMMVGSVLEIDFGPDDCVTSSEWWVQ